MISAIASARIGVQENVQRFEAAASQISQVGSIEPARIVDMKMAESAIKVNLGVIGSQADLYDHLVDILV